MEICTETFLDDVIRVQIYRTTACQSAIPHGAYIYEAEVSLGEPDIELALDASAKENIAVGSMSQSPTVKISNKQSRQGMIFQHDVTAQVDMGVNDVITATHKLRGRDVHIIYVTAGGSMYLTHSLPNTCSLTTEDNAGSNRTVTFKASIKSTSPLIIASEDVSLKS